MLKVKIVKKKSSRLVPKYMLLMFRNGKKIGESFITVTLSGGTRVLKYDFKKVISIFKREKVDFSLNAFYKINLDAFVSKNKQR